MKHEKIRHLASQRCTSGKMLNFLPLDSDPGFLKLLTGFRENAGFPGRTPGLLSFLIGLPVS